MKCSISLLCSSLLLLILMGSFGAFFVFSSVGAIDEQSTVPFLHRPTLSGMLPQKDGVVWIRSVTSVGGPSLLRLSWGEAEPVDPSFTCSGARMRDQVFVDTDREYRLTRINILDDSCVGVYPAGSGAMIEVAPQSFFQMSQALSASGVSRASLRDAFALYSPPDLGRITGSGGILYEVIAREEGDLDRWVDSLLDSPVASGMKQDIRYISPVLDKKLAIRPDIIPNARRPYRSETTDAIHHGYDIFAPVGSPVVAPSTAWVFRTVDGFVWSDFAQLKKSTHLSSLERAQNLDIYRGNQIWLITSRGDIFIYSHLSSLEPLSIGERVTAGQVIGYVGDSGVPEKHYRFPHLHFEIVPSPLVSAPRKLPSIDTILEWDWAGEGHSQKEVIDLTEAMFASGVVVRNGH